MRASVSVCAVGGTRGATPPPTLSFFPPPPVPTHHDPPLCRRFVLMFFRTERDEACGVRVHACVHACVHSVAQRGTAWHSAPLLVITGTVWGYFHSLFRFSTQTFHCYFAANVPLCQKNSLLPPATQKLHFHHRWNCAQPKYCNGNTWEKLSSTATRF